jgi:nitrate/nitrite transport system permease protein
MSSELTVDAPPLHGDADPTDRPVGPVDVTPRSEPPAPAAPSRFARVTRAIRSAFHPRRLARALLIPLIGILAFLGIWAFVAPRIDTSLGTLPGPADVAEAGSGLYDDWQASREAKAEFERVQDQRNDALRAAGREGEVQNLSFSGPPTFVDQVWTSLRTVGLGFLIASLVAIPLGLLSGLWPPFHAAINPLVQVMRPISPLAWLPIVTMVISALITSSDPFLAKSFIISALVVALCSLWPTLINTYVGTSSVDPDLENVARVLRLGPVTKLRKLVLPSALPYIFTGMRLSLGVGWMVLIAAEMLAQNPGLGKFVWDEFQNGSSDSLSRIMFAVVVIGVIGFLLDRLMSVIEGAVRRRMAS